MVQKKPTMAWCPACFAMHSLDGGDLVQHYADGRAAPDDVDLDFDERCEGSDTPGTQDRPVRTADTSTWLCEECARPGSVSDYAVRDTDTGERWHAECWHDRYDRRRPRQLDLLELLASL